MPPKGKGKKRLAPEESSEEVPEDKGKEEATSDTPPVEDGPGKKKRQRKPREGILKNLPVGITVFLTSKSPDRADKVEKEWAEEYVKQQKEEQSKEKSLESIARYQSDLAEKEDLTEKFLARFRENKECEEEVKKEVEMRIKIHMNRRKWQTNKLVEEEERIIAEIEGRPVPEKKKDGWNDEEKIIIPHRILTETETVFKTLQKKANYDKIEEEFAKELREETMDENDLDNDKDELANRILKELDFIPKEERSVHVPHDFIMREQMDVLSQFRNKARYYGLKKNPRRGIAILHAVTLKMRGDYSWSQHDDGISVEEFFNSICDLWIKLFAALKFQGKLARFPLPVAQSIFFVIQDLVRFGKGQGLNAVQLELIVSMIAMTLDSFMRLSGKNECFDLIEFRLSDGLMLTNEDDIDWEHDGTPPNVQDGWVFGPMTFLSDLFHP